MVVALQSIKENDFKQAYELIDELQKKWPDQPFIPQLISESIFFNENMSAKKKIETLEKVSPQTPAIHFYLSILYSRENQIQNLKPHLEKIFKDSQKFKMEFMGREEKIAAIYTYTCKVFSIENCLSLKAVKEQIVKNNFNEKFYYDYLQFLSSSPVYRVDLHVR
jgi:hypothetical protein